MDTLAREIRKLAKCLRDKAQSSTLKKKEKAAKILKAAKALELLKQRMR